METGLKPPQGLDVTSCNLSQTWRHWKEEFTLYMDLTVAPSDDKRKVKLFYYLIGENGRELAHTLLPDTDNLLLADIVQAFDKHCDPKKNETVERYNFFTRHQEDGENVDRYLTELRRLATTCGFGEIRDSLVCGIRGSHCKERLLREEDMTSEKCMQIFRAAELSEHSLKMMAGTSDNDDDKVHAVSMKGKTRPSRPISTVHCKYYVKRHERDKTKCSAYGETCRLCGKKNHFSAVCRRGTGKQNLSSADVGRQAMRNTPRLVDSLMHYIQQRVAAQCPDDKSVENCACILHNLSYHLDSEVPNKYTQLNEQMRNNQQTNKTSTGCFSNKSDKIQNNNFELPLPEEDANPTGSGLLSHSNAIRTYLSLLGQSKKDSTLEACAGALQNLTASKGSMSSGMSQIIGLKENGLPQIARLLQSGNSDVVKTGTSLLSNMSRHPSLHKSMGTQLLPDVSRLLSQTSGNSSNSEDILSSACYTMRNLVMAQPQLAKQSLSTNLVGNLVNMCKSGASPKAAEAARLFLTDMWSQKELQGLLKQQGLDKSLMGSLASSTLRSTVNHLF